MTTKTFFPGAVLDGGLWQNPNNILTANTARTTINIASTAQNTDHPIIVGNYPVDIPNNSIINSVTLNVNTLAANASGLSAFATVNSGGTNILSRAAITISNVATTRTVSFSPALSQLLDPTLKVTIFGRKDGSNSRVIQIDFASITVDYSEPAETIMWYADGAESGITYDGFWDGTSIVPSTYDYTTKTSF